MQRSGLQRLAVGDNAVLDDLRFQGFARGGGEQTGVDVVLAMFNALGIGDAVGGVESLSVCPVSC